MNSKEINIEINVGCGGYSIIQIALGVVMIVIGQKHLPMKEVPDDEMKSKEDDPCPNGAAYYLYVAGLVLLVTNTINFLSKVAWYLAERYGIISNSEAYCCLAFLKFGSVCFIVADLAILIWGSVVVFGAWANWTDDYDKYISDPEKFNYCANEPMMFAFVILIIKWVLPPCMLVLMCFCCFCFCWWCLRGNIWL